MGISKKLMRGLKDVSPLFSAAVKETSGCRALEVQVLGVSSPDVEGDSLLLNTFFASQMSVPEKPCSILSVLSRHTKICLGAEGSAPESFGDHLQRYRLYWDELRDLMGEPCVHRAGGVLQSRDIFLDFEYRHLLHFEKALCLLDKWVLLLRPTAESLTEGYKMMKAGLMLNPQMEFFIALSGKAGGARGEMIFERFSDFALKHLAVDLGWLGWLDLADTGRHFSADLYTEPLRYQHWNARSSLPKFVLADWIELMEKQSRADSFAGVSR